MLMLGATILTVQVKAGLIEPVGSGLTNQSPTAGSGLSVLSDNRPGNTSREAPTGQLAEVEGTVSSVQLAASGEMEIEISDETNDIVVQVSDSSTLVPSLYSRVHVSGMVLSAPPAAGQHSGAGIIHLADLHQLQVLTGQMSIFVTNAVQLAQIQLAGSSKNLVLDLQGRILAVSPGESFLAFQDSSGSTLLDLGGRRQGLQPGHHVHLQGNAMIESGRVVLRDPAVVDNDGYHSALQKSGVIYLKTGKHPIRLAWFNGINPSCLEVYYQGPDLQRQKIPDSALFSNGTNPATGTVGWTNGLSYRCAEGHWFRVPNLEHQLTKREGRTSNFTLDVASRPEDVSLEFAGSVEVPHDGTYTFSTVSDDGSLLYVDEHPPRIMLGDVEALSETRPILACQTLSRNEQFQWSEVEGTITFVSEQADSLMLDLSSGSGTMRVEVADSSDICPSLLPHARIRATGVVLPTSSPNKNERTVAGTLLVPGLEQLEFLELPAARWDEVSLKRIGDCISTNPPGFIKGIVHVGGRVRMEDHGKLLQLDDGTGNILLRHPQPLLPAYDNLEALGCCSRLGTNVALRCVFYREPPGRSGNETKKLTCLRTTDQVKRLTREQAQQGYPVKMRGVITAILDTSFFLRDPAGGIYARWNSSTSENDVRIGDTCEIEGVTFAEFSPGILITRATFLGRGNLPEPLRPSWDRLVNGSLDTEYVEVQGMVTEVESNFITLLTSAGRVRLQMLEMQPQLLKHYENALVRIRGCVTPDRDTKTQQIKFGQLCFYNGSISLEEAAPADIFDVPLKRAADLLFFDYRAASFHRVRIAGQILHGGHGTCYLLDGTNSLRFVSKPGLEMVAGDLVEVVGFPEVEGPSPVLREAVTRVNGHAALPLPLQLPGETLWSTQNDGRRVRIKARLTNLDNNRAEQDLELQVGARRFICRLETSFGQLPWIVPGSTVEVTGVYAVLGGDHQSLDSFELLLNSPADVQILARPSWWTLRHTLTVLGVAAPIVLAAVVWIVILRRQVEKRTRQLALETRRHKQTEQQRVIEAERARIARDLHDALGATLTQIRFLSIRGSRASQMPEKSRSQMVRISEKSLEMVSTLDEIVWAVNPANDSLGSLATYLCHMAEEFFSSTPIRCRLDVDENLPAAPLTSEVRHHLYLAVREALNNIAKHSQATEVWFRLRWQNHAVVITLEDNGRGFIDSRLAGGDGLTNIRHRLEKIGGGFECKTRLGTGTLFRLWLPVEPSGVRDQSANPT